MKSYEVVGYAYEADVHCPACAIKRFGFDALDSGVDDREGNEVTPIFASDCEDSESCGDCGSEVWAADEDEDEAWEDGEQDETCSQCDTILDNHDPEGDLCKSCDEEARREERRQMRDWRNDSGV